MDIPFAKVKGQSHFAEEHCGVLQGSILVPVFFLAGSFFFLGQPF